MNRQSLQGSFNLTDPFEKNLYDFALNQGKTSSYLKRLIYLDKLSKESGSPISFVPKIQEVVSEETDIKTDAMKAMKSISL